jgi:hypothetical protein
MEMNANALHLVMTIFQFENGETKTDTYGGNSAKINY